MVESSHEIVNHNSTIDSFFLESIDKYSYVSSHWHRSLEVIYLLNGVLEVTITGETFRLTKGDYIIITPKTIHSTHCPGENHAILIQISYDFLKNYVSDIDFLYFQNLSLSTDKKSNNKEIPNILENMLEIYKSNLAHSNLLFNKLLFELLYLLINQHTTSVNPATHKKAAKEFDNISRTLHYIQKNYNLPLTLQEIASYANFNTEYFCRYFKKYMGMTTMDYINSIRLEHIQKDLINTKYPLNYILEKHGFHNYKAFRKLFYDTFETTPSEFRKMHNPNN